jgi:hypothetical protein
MLTRNRTDLSKVCYSQYDNLYEICTMITKEGVTFWHNSGYKTSNHSAASLVYAVLNHLIHKLFDFCTFPYARNVNSLFIRGVINFYGATLSNFSKQLSSYKIKL